MTAATDLVLAEYWRLHPVEATHAGVHEFDDLAPDLSPDGLEARRAWRQRMKLSLGDLAELDQRVLRAELVRQEIVQDDWQWWQRAPQAYLEQALNGVQYLVARRPASAALAARLHAIPRILDDAKRNLRGDLVPPEYVEIALVGTAGAQRFLSELPLASEAARQAFAEFERFLREDLQARGGFALGRDAFERMLHEVHGVRLSADDVYQHGREMMEEAGYYDSPGLRLWRQKNATWRAVRLMVDVGLHCRGMRLEDAARPLIELGGLEPNTARGEALRYTSSPTQPSSYVLGRDRLIDLRQQASQRSDFDLAKFHHTLLGFSSVSPAFIPPHAF